MVDNFPFFGLFEDESAGRKTPRGETPPVVVPVEIPPEPKAQIPEQVKEEIPATIPEENANSA